MNTIHFSFFRSLFFSFLLKITLFLAFLDFMNEEWKMR